MVSRIQTSIPGLDKLIQGGLPKSSITLVSGTPGTGKTTLAKKLSEIMKFAYIDANKVIAKYNLSEGYDYKRKSKIIDTKKLNSKILEIIKEILKAKLRNQLFLIKRLSKTRDKMFSSKIS